MAGIPGILNIASRSMWASQTGVEVASHNIANMNTPGFSRHEVMYDPSLPVNIRGMLLGSGVRIAEIRSVQDRFLNFQLFQANSNYGFASARGSNLAAMQEVFNESDDTGLSPALSKFFGALQDLASIPDGQAERVSLVGQAKVLVQQFHLVTSRLKEQQKSADTAIRQQVDQVNNIARQIADLNTNIRIAESSGQQAADFRSARTQLMSELAQYTDFSSFENADGTINIVVAGGMPLVEQHAVGKLVAVSDASGLADVAFQDPKGNQFVITDKIKGGSIAGHIAVRDADLQGLLDQVDEMAYTLVNELNAVHNAGFGLNGSTGIDFFAPLPAMSGAAGAIAIDAAILADVNNIAASVSGEPGDNRNAQAMALLEDAGLFNGGTWTFQDFHGSIVGGVGVETQSAISETSHQEAIREQVVNLRESQSGVTLEEEMANLMKFQHAFEASARLFNTVQELFDSLADLR